MTEEAATTSEETPQETGTMFRPDAETPASEVDARPEWLLEKFNSPEDQAKAYNELYGAYSKKTNDLREEVKAEAASDYAKSLGVPEDINGYAYPEGFEAPPEEVDQTLREWAKNNNVGEDAFKSLISDVYQKTQVNYNAEIEKLGENANNRIDKVNKWVSANVDEKHFEKVSNIMTDAGGVEFFEYMMNKNADRGFAPDDLQTSQAKKPLTREGIREMQADPRFGENSEYTAMVRRNWEAFSKQQGL